MGLLVAIDLYRGGVPQQHYEFSSDSQRLLRMGKLASAQVRLDDPAASRIHAIIELSTTQAMLVDMGADAGTFVNGRRISKVKLSHGDQITVGETVLVVGLGVTAREATAPAALSPELAAGGTHPLQAAPVSVAMAAPALAPAPAAPPHSAARYAIPNRVAAAGAAPAAYAPAPSYGTRPSLAAQAPFAPPAPAPAPAPAAAAGGFGATAASIAAGVAYASTPASVRGMTAGYVASSELMQRVVAKLAGLSPDALEELEQYADRLRQREQRAVGSAAAAAGFGAAASPSGARAGGISQASTKRDTLSLINQMRRDRRVQQLAAAGVMLAVVIVLAVIVLRSPASGPGDFHLTPPAAGTSPAPAVGTEAAAAAAPPAIPEPPPPASDDKTVVYRLPKDQSLRDLASELWPHLDHSAALLSANPTLTSLEAAVPKATYVRVPRTTTYKVRPGDTLADIAAKTLGQSEAYGLIQQANRATLPDADSLEAGMVLTIPLVSPELEKHLSSAAQPAAAGAASPPTAAAAAASAPPAPSPAAKAPAANAAPAAAPSTSGRAAVPAPKPPRDIPAPEPTSEGSP